MLRINDNLDITIRLEVGNITETVEVRSGTPLLETASGTIGQVMDERRMLELPQKGGNPLELQRLVPGVVNLTNIRTMKSSSPSGTSQSSVNGTGTNQTLFNIDGVSNSSNDGGGGKLRVAFIPPSAAIVGFKMESNPYDASVGHVFGPVINITTKGGANEPHGSVYYWANNSAFDAMNFFSDKAGLDSHPSVVSLTEGEIRQSRQQQTRGHEVSRVRPVAHHTIRELTRAVCDLKRRSYEPELGLGCTERVLHQRDGDGNVDAAEIIDRLSDRGAPHDPLLPVRETLPAARSHENPVEHDSRSSAR